MTRRTTDDAMRRADTGTAGRAVRRPRALAVVLAVCVAVLLSAVPGVAAAAPTVAPIVDCYRANSDGSYTIVLGYTNPFSKTTNIPYGPRNIIHPAKFQKSQPTQFRAGTKHGVFSVRATEADLYANARWELDGNTLAYWSASSVTECSPSTPLPALGNGAGLALALVAGGGFGVLFVRRLIRRSVAPPA
jgi:hypothetical protein